MINQEMRQEVGCLNLLASLFIIEIFFFGSAFASFIVNFTYDFYTATSRCSNYLINENSDSEI